MRRPFKTLMSMFTRNRLLPILAGLLVVVAVLTGARSCGGGEKPTPVLDTVPQASMPDADTPADTIKTLTANVSGMASQLNALRQDNAELRQENRDLIEDRSRIESAIVSKLKGMLDEREQDSDSPRTVSAIAALTERLDALARRFSEEEPVVSPSDAQIPVGRGLDAPRAREGPVWIEPLEQGAGQGPDGTLPSASPGVTGSALDRARPALQPLAQYGHGTDGGGVAVYTVPRNATLVGSVGMTALVGRIPVQGQVQDPMPFKVITGADNLAANGLRIPGVEGMIWSGTAIGDWTLSCVSGQIGRAHV